MGDGDGVRCCAIKTVFLLSGEEMGLWMYQKHVQNLRTGTFRSAGGFAAISDGELPVETLGTRNLTTSWMARRVRRFRRNQKDERRLAI